MIKKAAVNIDSSGKIVERCGFAGELVGERIDVGIYHIHGALDLDELRWSIATPKGVQFVNQIESDTGVRVIARDHEGNATDIPKGRVMSLNLIIEGAE